METIDVIFLDVDGVLNCGESYLTANFAGTGYETHPVKMGAKRNVYKHEIVPSKVILLAEILKITGAKLVISSTWRLGRSLEEFEDLFSCVAPNYVRGSVIDKTPRFDAVRGEEIKHWLEEHPEVKNYVILDDDSDMLPEQMPHFVHTSFAWGFTTLEAILVLHKLGHAGKTWYVNGLQLASLKRTVDELINLLGKESLT